MSNFSWKSFCFRHKGGVPSFFFLLISVYLRQEIASPSKTHLVKIIKPQHRPLGCVEGIGTWCLAYVRETFANLS